MRSGSRVQVVNHDSIFFGRYGTVVRSGDPFATGTVIVTVKLESGQTVMFREGHLRVVHN